MITHRKDSIVEIKKNEAAKQKGLMTIGKQLAKMTVENAEKEKTITIMGKQLATALVKIAKLEKENAEKKGEK